MRNFHQNWSKKILKSSEIGPDLETLNSNIRESGLSFNPKIRSLVRPPRWSVWGAKPTTKEGVGGGGEDKEGQSPPSTILF